MVALIQYWRYRVLVMLLAASLVLASIGYCWLLPQWQQYQHWQNLIQQTTQRSITHPKATAQQQWQQRLNITPQSWLRFAEAQGIQVLEWLPENTKRQQQVTVQTIEVKLLCRYAQWLTLLKWTSQYALIQWQWIDIKPEPNSSRLLMTLKLRQWYSQSSDKSSGVALPSVSLPEVRDPFHPQMRAWLSVQNPLLHTPLSELKLVGNIQWGKRWLALVQVPTGQVYSVMVGQRLGVEQASVQHISLSSLTVKVHNELKSLQMESA